MDRHHCLQCFLIQLDLEIGDGSVTSADGRMEEKEIGVWDVCGALVEVGMAKRGGSCSGYGLWEGQVWRSVVRVFG